MKDLPGYVTTDKSSAPAHYLPSTHPLVLQHGDGLPHHARAVQDGHLAQAGHGAGQGDHCTPLMHHPYNWCPLCEHEPGPRQADQEDAGRGEEEEPGRGQAGQEGEEEGGGRGAGRGARDQG